jgi:TldD protein
LIQDTSEHDGESYAIGVRALCDTAWGFASSPVWMVDNAVRLAREAAAQAKFNARGAHDPVVLAPVTAVTGSWTMPVRSDPWTIPLEERQDLFNAWQHFAKATRRAGRGQYRPTVFVDRAGARFVRQERALATTDGTYVTQVIYRTQGEFSISVHNLDSRYSGTIPKVSVSASGLEPAGAGWEHILDADIRSQIPELIERAEELMVLMRTAKPAEIGRYDLVCDAHTMAGILDTTLGRATELDRARGLEANAGGTSYLGPDPMTFLGTRVGSPLVTVSASRARPKGVATVRWDEEGVVPSDFTLVKDGVLAEYQTTREQAAWLAPWYRRNDVSVTSRGCAGAESALAFTMQRSPDLQLHAGTDDVTFDELVAGVQRGIAVIAGTARADFQAKNGVGSGMFREIVDGKLGDMLVHGEFLFSAPEFWKNIIAIGGQQSVVRRGVSRSKGQPSQEFWHSVDAVPAVIKDVAVARDT